MRTTAGQILESIFHGRYSVGNEILTDKIKASDLIKLDMVEGYNYEACSNSGWVKISLTKK